MANYQFSKNYSLNPEKDLWEVAINYLKKKKSIFSINGIEYKLISVSSEVIKYQADSRNGGQVEHILKEDFLDFVRLIKNKKAFNTSNIKGQVSGKLYKKRSPVFAVLLATKIIEEI